MSANGKSSGGGGGDDVDDEDGIHDKAKLPDKEMKASLAKKSRNTKKNTVSPKQINTSILSSVSQPAANQPTSTVLHPQSGLQTSALHPHIPPMIPSHTRLNRPSHPIQSSPSSNQASALLTPTDTNLHQIPSFPPTISEHKRGQLPEPFGSAMVG